MCAVVRRFSNYLSGNGIQKGMRFMGLGNDAMWLMDASQKAVMDVREVLPT